MFKQPEPLLTFVYAFVCAFLAWGICAGAILLAREVTAPPQESLAQMDITVARNAFGRQINSFIDKLTPTENWKAGNQVEGVFIRAPKILTHGKRAKPLFLWENEVVMVEEDARLASTFHPELTESNELHRYFLSKCEA